MGARKTLRKTGLTILVLLVLFIGGGITYALVIDRVSTNNQAKTTPVKVASESDATIKPTKPSPNAPEGVAIGLITTPVTAGSNASLQVRTNPGSSCMVSVVYNGVASKDSGLAPKMADNYGVVSWTWTVEPSVPPGNWPVNITCNYHGRTGVVQTSLQVTK